MLPPALATLLDDARAEAKRAGHPGLTPMHLAAALARRAPEAFEAAFGAGSAAAIRTQLLKAVPVGTEAETVALLEQAGSEDPAAVLALLAQRLGPIAPNAGPQTSGPKTLAPQTAGANAPAPPSPSGVLMERVVSDSSITGFEEVVAELISLLSMRTPATPLLRGPSGSGKSSVVVALATTLAGPDYTGPLAGSKVIRVNPAQALSGDPVAALDQALDAQQPDEIVAVDDLETLLSLGSAATILPMLARLRGAVADPQARVIMTIDDAYASRLEAVDQDLVAMLQLLEVPALGTDRLREIATYQAQELAAHHGVELPEPVVRLAAAPRAATDRRAHPGLLIDRLDRACACAAVRADRMVAEADLGLAASPEVGPLDAEALVTGLRARVRGQDGALRAVAYRLALTRAQLDLRPERPDGVFLFVGPTGVGKTELARALCEQLFGDEERMIRLDMSEYAEPWALSRLIGPQPGYVGFTEPESWLTTRIRRQPDTVLLLDEIEKAHPTVWNTFLSVFDVGRLSDARGNVAHFERTIVAMTSNLGSGAPGSAPVGFSPADDEGSVALRDRARVLEAVKRAMPPELVNRLDETIVFSPLTREAIAEIAQLELDRLRGRLAGRGYVVTIGHDVTDLIATAGYDPAYGARHLQRNIERLLLEPLAGASGRTLTAELDGEGRVRWSPT